jgi:hypothetical protein
VADATTHNDRAVTRRIMYLFFNGG